MNDVVIFQYSTRVKSDTVLVWLLKYVFLVFVGYDIWFCSMPNYFK